MGSRARELRKDQTDAERMLWFHLRNRQLLGRKFRRQYPVSRYIVDFVCLEGKLIIEVDGGQHALDVERDNTRKLFLEKMGFRVIRFWDNDVLRRTADVLEAIFRELNSPSP